MSIENYSTRRTPGFFARYYFLCYKSNISRGLLGQSEAKTTSSSAGDERPRSTHNGSSASACESEISDIFDESWMESTIKANESQNNESDADQHREPKPSNLYKYVLMFD